MNKIIFYIWGILLPSIAFSQLQFSVNSSNNYTSIHDYNGRLSNNAYELKFTYTGTNLNVPYWRVSVRLKQPIMSAEGNQIPPDKISFAPTHTQGQATPNGIPSIAQIGMPSNVSLNGFNESFLVPQSNAPLYNVSQYSSWYNLQLHFNLIIAGGGYLESLQGGNTQKRYTMILEFKAYGGNNEVLGVEERSYTIDIFKLSGTPPVTNKYSVLVSANAKNALLELQKVADYANGASVVYQNGLAVSTNSDYQITVRSLNNQFNATNSSGTLPLDVVKIDLIPASSGGNVFPVTLSSGPQKISDGGSTQNAQKFFHIRYATSPGDSRLINNRVGQYTTTLEFQIIPR